MINPFQFHLSKQFPTLFVSKYKFCHSNRASLKWEKKRQNYESHLLPVQFGDFQDRILRQIFISFIRMIFRIPFIFIFSLDLFLFYDFNFALWLAFPIENENYFDGFLKRIILLLYLARLQFDYLQNNRPYHIFDSSMLSEERLLHTHPSPQRKCNRLLYCALFIFSTGHQNMAKLPPSGSKTRIIR